MNRLNGKTITIEVGPSSSCTIANVKEKIDEKAFNWHYLQCVHKKFGAVEYDNLYQIIPSNYARYIKAQKGGPCNVKSGDDEPDDDDTPRRGIVRDLGTYLALRREDVLRKREEVERAHLVRDWIAKH